jgi:hypothetical protein
MKYLKLYEQFRLILEATGKRCVLIDGTSSAGKSYMTKGLKEKGWVVIGSDDFAGNEKREDCDPLMNRLQFDHEGNGVDIDAGEEFHKKMKVERKGGMGERGATTVGFPGHPKNKEFVDSKAEDPRVWYMYQDYLYGRGKNATGVIFDDISDDILKYVPDCEYILLYAPLDRLKLNVIGRAEIGDKRGGWVFSDQFLKRFVATENKEESFDKEGAYTKESLKELLSDKDLQDSFNAGETLDVDKFINDLGVKEDGKKYYMKHRSPLKDGQKFFNSRNKTPENLEKFIG